TLNVVEKYGGTEVIDAFDNEVSKDGITVVPLFRYYFGPTAHPQIFGFSDFELENPDALDFISGPAPLWQITYSLKQPVFKHTTPLQVFGLTAPHTWFSHSDIVRLLPTVRVKPLEVPYGHPQALEGAVSTRNGRPPFAPEKIATFFGIPAR